MARTCLRTAEPRSSREYALADYAGVAELADAPGLGPGPFGGGGSSPFARTRKAAEQVAQLILGS